MYQTNASQLGRLECVLSILSLLLRCTSKNVVTLVECT